MGGGGGGGWLCEILINACNGYTVFMFLLLEARCYQYTCKITRAVSWDQFTLITHRGAVVALISVMFTHI